MPGTQIALSVMLVEDHLLLRQELSLFLQGCGHTVLVAGNGIEMDEQLLQHTPQVVVLDLNLPGEDGLKLAQRLRQLYPCMGIVMLTARSLDHQRLAGYENGADIYLSKPANLVELQAVVQNLGMRLASMRASLQQNAWRLDAISCLLTSPSGLCKVLSKTETLLLQLLNGIRAMSIRKPLSLGEMIEILNSSHGILLSEANLRVAISRLRSKIEELAPGAPSIESQRGQGYLLAFRLALL
jgi:DNA-binding response OmpR family regulator